MNGYNYDPSFDGSNMNPGGQVGEDMMMMGGQDGMGNGMVGGQSLEDIVNQNAKVIRRQSMPQQFASSSNNMDADMRRISMTEYNGVSPAGPIGSFQYNANVPMHQRGMMGAEAIQSHQQRPSTHSRRQSHQGDLALNTTFPNTTQGFTPMMQNNTAAYGSPAHPNSGFDMTMDSPYIDPGTGMQMDYNLDQSMAAATPTDASQMNLYSQPQFNQPMAGSPMHAVPSHGNAHSGQTPVKEQMGDGSGMNTQYGSVSNSSRTPSRHISRSQSLHLPPNINSPAQSGGGVTPLSQQGRPPKLEPHNTSFTAQPQNPIPGSQQDVGMGNTSSGMDGINGPIPVDMSNYNPNSQHFEWDTPDGGWPSSMIGRPHVQTSYKNAYSSTGFDMLGVLMRVATRPAPQINIGAVDLSCAFVVCDAEKDDFPIVYCSENFERLTGYTKHMILGRNCRFLQSPDGNVKPGVRRKYVDDDSVLYLKNMISMRREAQISLINYRRGGQPFMNLLTMIPIAWETDQVKFFVGFQVDLVEQPNAVTNRNADGSYSINYQRGMTMPRYVVHAAETVQKSDVGQTVPKDDVSAILSTYGNGESEYAKRMWDKVLLENTDDVVHVLSLKGLFQWVSPSAARVLEYEPSEIIGTALSSVCHPSDIVPVTRELKDTSSGATVNVVFRIRRKNSGYMWFEGHGSLHTEQGKGRKSIILVGRERPVYTLSQSEIAKDGGIGENELWTKMSTSGMFLFVSSNVRQLLDRQPDELVGISIQTMMRADSKADFGRILEHARTGKKAHVKHEMINRRGQVLSAFTTLYPGDATEGQKPTFIVARTQLIKFTRGTASATRPPIYPKQERNSSESVHSGVQSNMQTLTTGDETPASAASGRYRNTDSSAATYSGQNGLMIGHQDDILASEDNLFDELKTTKSSSWQYEIRQLEKKNRILAEEVQSLIAAKKKRKRRRGKDQQKDCANCHTRVTPEWRRGPSGQRDLCNSCGLRWAKLNGRVSPRASSQHSGGGASDKASKASASPRHSTGGGGPSAGGVGGMKAESPAQHSASAALSTTATPGVEPRESPKMRHAEGHAASMEGASGVPDKIDEGVEPD